MNRAPGILMVCMGNICRSPMAEGALRQRLAAAGLAQALRVDSAGTSRAHAGEPPDPRAVACAARHGVDIAAQRARGLEPEDYDRFDYLLCADRSVLHDAGVRKPRTAHAQVVLLLDWAGQGRRDVPDPYYGGSRDFEHVWRLVDAAAAEIVARVQAGAL